MNWEGAACADSDDAIFFDPDNRDPALAICEGCPIITECREYAVETNQLYGVWGGTIPYERYKIRKARKND